MKKQITVFGLLLLLKVPIIGFKSTVDAFKGGISDGVATFNWRMDRLDIQKGQIEEYKGVHINKEDGILTHYWAFGGEGIKPGKTFYSLKSVKRYIDKVRKI